MIIGYARVSRVDQNLDLQLDALKAAGCTKIFTDKISGAKAERAGLSEILEFAREGDTIAVWRLDRLARSLADLISILKGLEERKIQFLSLTENIDTATTTGKLIFHIFAALAEFERNLLRERTLAGLQAARERGRTGGRKLSITGGNLELVLKLIRDGVKVEKIATLCEVSSRTIRRIKNGQYKETPTE